MPAKREISLRFWEKVAKSEGCWLWTATKTRRGYGHVRVGRRLVSAHRVSWVLANGEIPAGLSVCHRCDNPACVNPAHLFLGTHAENIQDAAAKGRMAHGERAARARLTALDVRWIRAYAAYPARVVGKAFGVGHACIWSIRSGRTWNKEVPA